MTVVALHAPKRLRLVSARNPERWLYAVAVTAALGLVVLDGLGLHDARAHAGHPSATLVSTAVTSWGIWMLMVLAMMLPVVAPLARSVALRSLRIRRYRSMVAFVLGYAGVWALVGLLLVPVSWMLAEHPTTPLALVAALVAAAVWQVTGVRKRTMRRCGSLRLRAGTGHPADRNCTAVGWTSGVRCLVTCGPAMAATAFSSSLLLMAAVLAVLLSERRRGPNPAVRAGRPLEAWMLLGIAAVIAGSIAIA